MNERDNKVEDRNRVLPDDGTDLDSVLRGETFGPTPMGMVGVGGLRRVRYGRPERFPSMTMTNKDRLMAVLHTYLRIHKEEGNRVLVELNGEWFWLTVEETEL